MKKRRSKRSPKLSPEKYAEILRGTELQEIFLESCSASVNREMMFGKVGIEVSIRERASYTKQDDLVKINHSFNLTCTHPEIEKGSLIKISATFCLLYTTVPEFDDDFFDVFKETTLPVVSWPYFREFVQNMTQRMSIPPLTLPLIKSE